METQCKICNNSKMHRFLELGNIPPVNAFIEKADIEREEAFPLNLAYCQECHTVQLEEFVDPEKLFSHYLHLSAGSQTNVEHLNSVASTLAERFKINENTKILEVGSNDGTLLSFFKPYTNNVLGVDPAKNLVSLNEEKGVELLVEFFGSKTAEKILEERGAYDLIVALNVFPHTPTVVDSLKGARTLLSKGGSVVMEGVYAVDTILRGEFDTIYHEHVYTFSLHALINTFKQANMKIVDVEMLPTQGGSLRIFAQREEEAEPVSDRVNEILEKEKAAGLTAQEKYDAVAEKVSAYKTKLRTIIEEEKAKNGKLIGLGAPARGTVIANYCNITEEDVEYLIDDTPLKQGKVMPGVHIPVTNWDSLGADEERTYLLLSWNYKDHLLGKLREKVSKGSVIIPFPQLEVVAV